MKNPAMVFVWLVWLNMWQVGAALAATVHNARSAMGINLAAVNYYTTEHPFINSFSTCERWVTHSDAGWDSDEAKYLNLDASGWPISLKSIDEPKTQQFTSVGVLFFLEKSSTETTAAAAEQYIVLYDGQGTMSYGLDAALVSRSPGRDVIAVTPSSRGVDLRIVATDPKHNGNYLRNIKVVSAANEAAVKSGHLFNPAFLNILENLRAVRFMDWFQTNGSTLASWAERPMPAQAFYGTSKGVPVEIAVQLANALSADAWMNIPVMADDNYIREMATLVRGQLGGTQKVYVELSNEVWNFSFSQSKYAVSQGQALWPTRPPGNGGYEYNRSWFGMRTAQMCDIWRAIWRSDPRLVCVLGAQMAWSFSATEAMKCPYWTQGAPCSGHSIDAIAIAPYLGGGVPAAWTSEPDGGLAKLFQALYSQNDPAIPPGGMLKDVATWQKRFASDVASYKLPLLAYEGGQGFAGGSTDALNKLYMAANRDPRLGQAYAAYFEHWKAAGGQLFMYYADVGLESKFGSWGALESITQAHAPLIGTPPKWQAMQKFISESPCWWPGCSGAVNASTTSR